MSDQPVRVLHLLKGLGPGGAEQLLVNQAVGGVVDDPVVAVAYLVPWKDHLTGRLEAAGWATVCLRGGRPWDPWWLLRLRREVVARRIDVVHGHSPLVSALARPLLRTLGRRRPATLYTEHNEWGRHNRWTRRLNRRTIGLEDHVLAVSHGVAASMPPGLAVEVLVHGIDVEAVAAQRRHRAEVRRELGVADGELVVGTVANLRREKAYDVLLDAAARVVAARPEVRFVAVGQGPLADEIRRRRDALGLGERFVLLGYRDDATRVMSGFDLFTLASRHEGLPVSLMEAVALGLPVVATAVGGIPEALAGTPAVLVAPDDAAALADALVADTARPCGADVRFDAAAAGARLGELYTALAERRRGRHRARGMGGDDRG